MRINRLIAAVSVAGLLVLASNVMALEVTNVLERGKVYTDGPLPKGDHDSVPPSGANTCPADNVGVLTDGDTVVGSTIG